MRRGVRTALVLASGIGLVAAVLSGAASAAPRPQKVDLSVTISDNPDRAPTGSTVTYSIVVTNLGSSSATGTKVVADLAEQMRILGARTPQGTCSVMADVECAIGHLPPGAAVQVSVDATSDVVGTFTTTATVSAEQGDSARSNNTASESTEIFDCSSCPTVSISGSPDPVNAGEVVTYEITGPSPGDRWWYTELVIALPPGTEYVTASSDFGGCSYKDRTVTCRGRKESSARLLLRTLEPGQLRTVAAAKSSGSTLATAEAVTEVLPPRATGANTPLPVQRPAESVPNVAQVPTPGDLTKPVGDAVAAIVGSVTRQWPIADGPCPNSLLCGPHWGP